MQLDSNQWQLVYNVFSFGLVSMLACTIYTLVSQQRVLPKYRNALVMSSMVTFIAGYHYLRIFDSFKHASTNGMVKLDGSQDAFNMKKFHSYALKLGPMGLDPFAAEMKLWDGQ